MHYENLKVTAKMFDGRIATTDGYLPLDSILAYVWMTENHPELMETDAGKNAPIIIPDNLPIAKAGEGDDWYYKCSFALFQQQGEYTTYWHKRFDQALAEELVDFGKKRGTVNVKSAQYKNYRTPLNIILAPEIVWYLVADKAEVERMVNQLTHIGKKASQGFGLIREWIVESWAEDLSHQRPIPDENGDDYVGIRPPYWYHQNFRRVKWSNG